MSLTTNALKLLTLARDLKRRKARERHGLFVAEGTRTVEALLASPLAVRGILVAEAASAGLDALRGTSAARNLPWHVVSEAEFHSAADTEAPQGILAIAEIPRPRLESLPATGDLLVLDAVQDPGNAGTIVRTAHALGACATLTLPGTVDLFNAKVVRSAMGALFTHPVIALSWEEASRWLTDRRIPLWAAAADGETMTAAVRGRPARVALVVANEGAGVSAQVAARAARRVSIPMQSGAESLNVAVASGILLYALQHGAH